MKLTVKKIGEICNGQIIYGNENREIESYCTDTRQIKKGDCYIGIKGENFNGNDFWQEATKKGASACILDSFEESMLDNEDVPIIIVKNSVEALQNLAKYVRENTNVPVIAITGSAGKTSTKDIVANVLSQKYKILKSPGNLNNHIGLPLTILSFKDEEMMVLEMGMNDLHQIEKLSSIAQPDVAIITNIGTAHIGNLGSQENILKAKLEILTGMKSNGTLIYNGDDLLLQTINNIPQRKICYGIDKNNDFIATNITIKNGHTFFEYKNHTIEVPILGNVFVYNSLVAIVVGTLFALTIEQIENGIRSFQMSDNRMQIIELTNYKLINDTYNANKEAMKSAIDSLTTYKERKVVILGDMLELGAYEKEIHEELGEYLNGKIDLLVTIGELSKYINNKFLKENYHFNNIEEAKKNILPLLKNNDVILIKASQGMKLFDLVDFLVKNQ